MNGNYDTFPAGGPVTRDTAASAPDLTSAYLRLIRRAMRQTTDATPLDLAIQSAVARAEPAGSDEPDRADEARAHLVAARLNAVLGGRVARAAGGAERHRETVRG